MDKIQLSKLVDDTLNGIECPVNAQIILYNEFNATEDNELRLFILECHEKIKPILKQELNK